MLMKKAKFLVICRAVPPVHQYRLTMKPNQIKATLFKPSLRAEARLNIANLPLPQCRYAVAAFGRKGK